LFNCVFLASFFVISCIASESSQQQCFCCYTLLKLRHDVMLIAILSKHFYKNFPRHFLIFPLISLKSPKFIYIFGPLELANNVFKFFFMNLNKIFTLKFCKKVGFFCGIVNIHYIVFSFFPLFCFILFCVCLCVCFFFAFYLAKRICTFIIARRKMHRSTFFAKIFFFIEKNINIV